MIKKKITDKLKIDFRCIIKALRDPRTDLLDIDFDQYMNIDNDPEDCAQTHREIS